MLEAVAYEYALYLGIEKSLLPDLEFKEARVIGGGAKSRLWNQIKADVLGIPYVQLSREEFAVLGSAIVAGCAVGVFSDLKATASDFVHPTSRIQPHPEYHEYYKPLADLYASLLSDMKPLFGRLAEVPAPPSVESG
jgi:xylulokinase